MNNIKFVVGMTQLEDLSMLKKNMVWELSWEILSVNNVKYGYIRFLLKRPK